MRQITTNLMNKEIIFKSAAEIFKHFLSLFGASPACEKQKINWGVNILRWGLGFIYLWFGVLKFFPQLSSAEQLAGTTIELMTFGLLKPAVSLPLLALWETAIGLALLTGKYQRIAVFSLYFHVAGTLLPLVLLPDQTWSLPPFAASLEGQYIFKNLVTVGAALVINASDGCRK
ncbi:MAG TPA: DoxX family protein [Pyrinomonadaceae bacterium]|nr:DoxX family protein [Pyrinomonadaceae bacterium]